MKTPGQKLLVLIFACLMSMQFASAQNVDTAAMKSRSENTYNVYWQRHKTFAVAGVAFVVPGSIMMGIAIREYWSAPFNLFNATPTVHRGNGLFLIGGGMVVASIPCFIISGINAHKARLELTSGAMPGPGGSSYASVGIKIKL